MTPTMVYVTAASREEATRIGLALVEARLAACANVFGEVTSIYWWQGKLEQGPETALVLKTRSDLVEAVIARVRALHSYACPCIVAWPLAHGNPAFLDWIAAETRA